MQRERRQTLRFLHQICCKGVAYAFASSPCDLERVEVLAEPGCAPRHHIPIPLVLLDRHCCNRRNRSLLPGSQNNHPLLVQCAFQGLHGRHANGLLGAAHLCLRENMTLLDVFTSCECSTFAAVPTRLHLLRSHDGGRLHLCRTPTTTLPCTHDFYRLSTAAEVHSWPHLPSLSYGSCPPLISVNSETSILWLLAVLGSSETWVP